MSNDTRKTMKEQSEADLLGHALAYAEDGWCVLPLHTPTESDSCSCGNPACESVGKHPRTRHGVNDATTDEETIRRWWEKWPEANVGIACGKDSGLCVLDVDPRNGGDRTLRDLEARHEGLLRTLKVHSGGGGEHYYFSYPSGAVANRKLGNGLDLQSNGKYVVAPPSLHASGNRYEWERSIGDRKLPELQPPPDWLLTVEGGSLFGEKRSEGKERDAILEGERNNFLTSVGGLFRKKGLVPEAIERGLFAVNEALCDPPLEEDEVGRTAHGMKRYAPDSSSEDAVLQGTRLDLSDPDPWSEPVEGQALLDALVETIERYLVLPDGAAEIMALWILHAHALESFMVTPTLALTSPVKGCGKTVSLGLLKMLVPRPLPTSNTSSAVVYRSIEKGRPTLLIDEADTHLHPNSDLHGILNSSHHRLMAYVTRCEGEGFEPRSFSTFAPKAIGLIGTLPGTLADRSIEVRMRRKTREEEVERLTLSEFDHCESLRSKAARFANDHVESLRNSDPDVPEKLSNRAADNWRPLLAIAEAAGGNWSKRARRLATLWADDSEAATTPQIQLLADLHELYEAENTDRLSTEEILNDLNNRDDRQWGEWKGKPLTPIRLANLLRPFGISSRTIRMGGDRTKKGYRRSDMIEAFRRYLPTTTRNSRNKPEIAGDSGTEEGVTKGNALRLVTDEEWTERADDAGTVTGVTAGACAAGKGS